MKNSSHLLSSGTALVALICISTACSSPKGGVTEGQALDDRKLTRILEDRLANDPVYKYGGVDVQTFNGVVQLSGFADAESQKQRAEQLAREIPGVVEVENAVMIKPRPAEAQRIRQELREVEDWPYPDPARAGESRPNTVNEADEPNQTRD